MLSENFKSMLTRATADYSMIFVLILLAVLLCVLTYREQDPTGAEGGSVLAHQLLSLEATGEQVLVLARPGDEESEFASAIEREFLAAGKAAPRVVQGDPAQLRAGLAAEASAASVLRYIGCTEKTVSTHTFVDSVAEVFPGLREARVVSPESYWWPTFIKISNLRNVADQIAVIAIIAIGMTLVIITGGIDLSVGSLIALSAVVSTLLIRSYGGAEEASALSMTLCCLGGIAICGLTGAFSGLNVVASIPPFIVTLSMMLVASGLAYWLTRSQSVYELPDSFQWLSREADILNIPNAVVLMVVLYAAAHIVMTRTVVGRYIYAVGGNREAARLSGVPVRRILLLVYTVSGLLAGLGGVLMASQLSSGSPDYGVTYELYVIAAVVVGGTSLMGGEGKILGTLIGAFIIAVIRNGMNLVGIESHPQKIVLGLVILIAVVVDMLKRRGWLNPARLRKNPPLPRG